MNYGEKEWKSCGYIHGKEYLKYDHNESMVIVGSGFPSSFTLRKPKPSEDWFMFPNNQSRILWVYMFDEEAISL